MKTSKVASFILAFWRQQDEGFERTFKVDACDREETARELARFILGAK